MEQVKIDTPNTSISPIVVSHLNSAIIEGSPDPVHRSKTNFRYIHRKIIEEAQINDIQLDIEDVQVPGYFDQDPELTPTAAIIEQQVNNIDRKKSIWVKPECNGYEIYFKPGVFFKFFFMHVLFYFCLGPFIALLSPIFGKHILRNQLFMGANKNVLRQTFEYLAIVSFIVVFYTTETKGLEAMEIYMICITIFMRLVVIASKYAYQSDCFIKLLHMKTLTTEEFVKKSMHLTLWRTQSDDIIEEEMQTAVLRQEIDSPIVCFLFLGKMTSELKEKLTSRKTGDMDSHINIGDEEGSHQIISGRSEIPIIDRNIRTKEVHRIKSATAQEEVKIAKRQDNRMLTVPIPIHKNFSYFLKIENVESAENESLCGFNLAFDILKNAKSARYKKHFLWCLFLSLFRALLPTFYRAYEIIHEDKDIPLFTDKPYIVAIIFFVNIFLFWANTGVIIIVIEDIKTRIFCLKQMGYLISPKKLSYMKDRKLYPTLNIFDPVTLKTWSSLRKLMNDYGKKFILRNSLNVIVAMTFYFFIIAILILEVLGIIDTYQDPLLFIVFGYESLVYFVIFVTILWGAAFINDQYKVHKNLLKKNKTIIADFQRLSYLYVGPHAVEPDNPIYKEGLRLLKEELGDKNFEKKLIERADKLSSMIDDIIEELEFEEENEPFCVMGIAVHYSLLKSMAVGIVSLVFAIGQSFMN